jgi:hypothetical protein
MTVAPPIVIDLGRVPGREIDRLRQGRGPLVEDLEEVMRLVRLRARPDSNTTTFLPIVAVYRRDERDNHSEMVPENSPVRDRDT